MLDFELTADPFLGGYSQDFDGTLLAEVTDLSLISVAQPLGGKTALTKAMKSAFGTAIPAPGASEIGKPGATALGMGPDQILVLLPARMTPGSAITKLGAAAYCTDQSHNWVGLRINGPHSHAALERICPVDIAPHAFPAGSVARTSMEHLGAIILAEGENSFLLLSASSSAASFLHALEISIKNVM